MAQLEDMRLPVAAREALVDDPNFLRQLVEPALNRFLDAEISEHLQVSPYERSEARTGYRNGYRARQLKTRVGPSPWRCRWIATAPSARNSSIVTNAARRRWSAR